MNTRIVLVYLFLLLSPASLSARTVFVPDVSHQTFRDEVVNFVRAYASEHIQQAPAKELNQLEKDWDNHYQRTNWQITIEAFYQGDLIGEGYANGKDLTKTLRTATLNAMQASAIPDNASVNDYRFRISFDYHPARRYSLLSYQGKGIEAVGNRVAVRRVDTAMLRQQIKDSLAYLLRQEEPNYHGFFKFYDADTDKAENLLRTTYTASSLYSLIKLDELMPDAVREKQFPAIAQFLLDRQLHKGPQAGGFDYGFDPETQKGTCRIVVGTTSKTIYTLLLMNDRYPDDKQYIQSAKAAGDWLLKMIKDDGNVIPIARCKTGDWQYKDKQSFLYTGQVLSALSRLYRASGEQRYLDGAHKIAALLLKEVDKQGPLVADDYRPANSISSSWVMMSLIDLAKADPQPVYLDTITDIADTLLERQIDTEQDIFSYGRYLDAMTTSGNGWINEVMGEWYGFCQQQHLSNCEPYREAMRHTSRWLIQNAFNAANSYDIKNPSRAQGGFITNFNTLTVRTDAVCHGLNGMVSLLKVEADNTQPLVDLPQQPLREILPLMRAGQ